MAESRRPPRPRPKPFAAAPPAAHGPRTDGATADADAADSADHRRTRRRVRGSGDRRGRTGSRHALLDAAEKDAVQTRQARRGRGGAAARDRPVRGEAQEERAKRRLADAESGCQAHRERAAADLEALQRETYSRTGDAGRGDRDARQGEDRCDQARTEARAQLDKARAEVATLARRRDDINAQLGTSPASSGARRLTNPEPAPRTASQYSMEEE